MLAAVSSTPIGTPRPSVRTWRFVPSFARSVGLGPVWPPLWSLHRGAVEGAPLEVDANSIVVVMHHLGEEDVEHTPASAHAWNRLCTADPLPNCRGSAFHWHPVFRRYTIPAIARRSSSRDRPPRACDGGSGNQGSTYFQTSSGTSANLASIPSKDHAALRLATFRQVRGGALSMPEFC
jgi:hypothetical protein